MDAGIFGRVDEAAITEVLRTDSECALIELTEDDLKLLREMWRSGGKKYTAGAIDRRRYARLESAGLLKGSATNVSDVVYELLPAAGQHIEPKS